MKSRLFLRMFFGLSWQLYAVAVAFSCLLVFSTRHFVILKNFSMFQEQLDHTAAHLADGRKKALVLGSMITVGQLSSVIKATASGSLPPDNPEVLENLKQLEHEFSLSNIFVMNREGIVVAYQISSGKSGTGRDLSFRPYFRSAIGGIPNMYAALGTNTVERGFYIAAPIFKKQAISLQPSYVYEFLEPTRLKATSTQEILGVVVSKLGFEEVDQLLETYSDPLAVVSPEGVVFASNMPAWRFKVLGTQKDLELAKRNSRVSKAFEKESPQCLKVDGNGCLENRGQIMKMASSVIKWNDPQGSWRLVGFDDPKRSLDIPVRLAIGFIGFAFTLLIGGWWQEKQRLAERTVELEDANCKLAALSNTDSLTSLSNRRHFDDVLANEYLRAKRNCQTLALLMIDVDYFKLFNDRYGHLAGDECLKNIARILKPISLRTGDLSARYGGEEFSLILVNCDIDSAQRVAESIRNSVESLDVKHELSPSGRVTVSIGVAVITPDINSVAETLLRLADNALYRAKNEGRNRVVLSAAVIPKAIGL